MRKTSLDDKRGSSSQKSWSIDKLIKENIKKFQQKSKKEQILNNEKEALKALKKLKLEMANKKIRDKNISNTHQNEKQPLQKKDMNRQQNEEIDRVLRMRSKSPLK